MSEREEKIRQRREALERRIKQRRARRTATTGQKLLDVAKQAALGMNEGLLSTSIGINELLGLEGQAAKDREVRRQLREDVGPSLSKAGTLAGVGGRIGYEGAEFIATGAGALKAAKGVGALAKGSKAAKVAKAGSALERAATVTKGASRTKRIIAGTAAAAPLNIAKSQGREESAAEGLAEMTGSETLAKIARSRPGRAAFEVALDAVAGGAIEGVGALKHIRDRRAARQRLQEMADEAPSSAKEGDELRGALTRRSRRKRGRLLPPGARPMPGEISDAEKLKELQRQTRLASAERTNKNPPTSDEVVERVIKRSRGEDIPPQPVALKRLPAGPRAMPGEITPEEKLARVQRETLLSIAEKTAAHPPTSDEVIERVIARRREQDGSRDLERQILKALGTTPRRSTAGQMIEMDVRKKHGAYKSPLAEPFETREPPAQPAQPPRERVSIEEQQRLMQEPAAARAAEEEAAIDARYRRTTDDELLTRAGSVFERMATLDPVEFRNRHRIGDDARILREIERVARKRGLLEAEETLEDAIQRHAERAGLEQEGAEDAATQFPFGDDKTPRAMHSMGGAAAGAAAGGAQEDEDGNRMWLAGAALGVGGVAAFRAARRGGIKGGAGRVPVTKYVTKPPKPAKASAAAAVDPDEFANIRKFALDESGEARLREEVQSVVASRELAPKERVTWDETREIAQRLGLDITAIAREKAGRLSGPEMLAIRNVVSQNIRHAEQLSKRMFNPDIADEARAEAGRLIGMLDAQNDALLGRFVKERTQAGRDLNNLKIVAANSLDPAVWFARAKRILGERALTDEHRIGILRLINTSDRDGLARYVAGMREVTAAEKLVTLWKAGLLTAPTTHLANFLGNTTMAVLETAKDAPALLFDRLIGVVTGNATKGGASTDAIRASWRGARKGFRAARRVMKGEQANDALQKYDFAREIDFDNVFLDRYTKTVFRALGASDRIFRGMALERSLAEQARAVAKSEGAQGAAFAARVRQLQADPTDAMVLRAIGDAELATFTNRGALGQAAQGLRRPLGAVGDVLIPFTMTPANVVSRAAEYSPLGLAQAVGELLYRATRGELDQAMQRKLVDRMGRSAIGTMPIVAGYILAERGLLTAGRPKDTSTQDEWALEGKQENAVNLGGKWRSLERLSPLGNLLVLGAHLYEAGQDPEATLGSVALAGAASIGQTVTEQSFLEGVTRAGDALRDSRGATKRWAKSMAGSVVPNVVARAARATDPFERETETPADAIKARIPGMRQQLPTRVDQLGHEVRRESSGAGVFADPFASTEDRAAHDPVVSELQRTGATITNLKRQKGEPRARYQKRRLLYGRVVERALVATIESEEYQRIPAIARALSERHPKFRGRDASQLARELQQAELEDVVRNVRRQLTVATKP
jgi:hypothetical protein